MSFDSDALVAAATAASTEAPGAAAIFARSGAYRPVIELTASKTEAWTIAMILTAGGVAGCFAAISAAFAFASVTTSAWTPGAPASNAAVTIQIPMRMNGPPSVNRLRRVRERVVRSTGLAPARARDD